LAKTRPRNHQASQEGAASTARELALAAHEGQTRPQTEGPFADHPLLVAELVASTGADECVIAAAHLHDAVEKTGLTADEVSTSCGDDVAALVVTLTEDPSIDGYRERKRDLRRRVIDAGRPATLLYAADRVANLRDWTSIDPSRRDEVGSALGTSFQERIDLWREDLVELNSADPALPLLAEIEIELGRLSKAS